MAYSSQIMDQAAQIISDRRKRALDECDERERSLRRESPTYADALARRSASARSVLQYKSADDVRSYINSLRDINLQAQEDIKTALRAGGYPDDYLTVHYTCPICEDTGVHEGKYCTCFISLVKQLAAQELNKSSSMRLKTFSQFSLNRYRSGTERDNMQDVLDYCVEWSERFVPGRMKNVLMSGRPGTGKTHLSLAMASACIEKGYSAVYGSAQRLLSKIEEEHFGRPEDSDSLDRVLECDLLVLDDLGTEFLTQFARATIYTIINERSMASLPTIISTNLDLEKIKKNYGEAVYSRLRGDYQLLEFVGNDIRGRGDD